MKRILLFITATLLLVPGTSCSDDNTGCNPTSDELGILYKDGHDVYGVEVWEETSVILTNYYSLIEEIIQEKTAKIRCASYCRVSSDSEDQLNSFMAQTLSLIHISEPTRP